MNDKQDTLPADIENMDIGSEIHIRRAQTGEYKEIGNVLFAAFTASGKVSQEYERRVRSIAQRSTEEDVWVASTQLHQIVGASLTTRPGHTEGQFFTFNTLAVLPHWRGHGIGYAFVQHAVDLASYYGFDELLIHSGPDMKQAHHLYYRFGFRRRIDWETLVVDGGQRLLTLTYRINETI